MYDELKNNMSPISQEKILEEFISYYNFRFGEFQV